MTKANLKKSNKAAEKLVTESNRQALIKSADFALDHELGMRLPGPERNRQA